MYLRVTQSAVCAVLLCLAPVSLLADPAPQSTLGWMINGIVSEVVRAGDTAYLGGSFSTVSPAANKVPQFVTFSTRSARPVLPRLRVNGRVRAVAEVPGGGWILGGEFTSVNGSARKRLVKLHADGTLDPSFDVVVDSTVRAAGVSGNTVYFAGSFLTVAGVARLGVAAVDLTTGALVTDFAPAVVGGTVRDLVVDPTSIYLAGDFSSVNATSRSFVARVDRSTGALMPFDAAADGSVYRIVKSGDDVFAVGDFLNIGGLGRRGAAKLDAITGAAASAFNAQLDFGARAIALSANTLYLGGGFSQAGGQSRSRIAALSPTTGNAESWNPGANSDVTALALSGTTLIAGGSFKQIDGEERLYLAALDTTQASNSLLPWNPALNNSADLVVSDSTGVIFVGGSFTGFGAVRRDNLAAINLQRGDLASWNPGANGWIHALDIQGNTLYIGGEFTTIGGVSRSRIAAVNARTGVVGSWNPAPNGHIKGIMVAGTNVYFVGAFTSLSTPGGSTSRGRGAAVDVDGTVRPWNPSANDEIASLFVDGERVYVGGKFTMLGGQTHNRLGAVSATDGVRIPEFTPSVDAVIYRVDVQDGVVYFGGGFDSVNGSTRNSAAAVQGLHDSTPPPPGTPSPGTLLGWNPNVGGPVYDIDAFGESVYLTGGFGSVNGSSRPGIASVSSTPGSAILDSWKPTDVSGGQVSVIDTSDEAVLFGGSLKDLDGVDVGAVLYPDQTRRTAPRAPTTPEVSVNGSSVNVTWSRPPLGSAPESYVIEGGSAPGRQDLANFSTGSSDTAFAAAGLGAGTYFLRMRSANAHGLSQASDEFAFTVGAGTCTAPPLPPLDLSAMVAGNDITLAWRASPRSVVTRYVLRAGAVSGASNLATLDIGLTTSVVVSAPGGAFFLTLVAVNDCGTSVPSEEAVAVVGGAPVPPGRPFNLEALVTGNSVLLSWAAPTIGTGSFQYVVEVGTAPGLSNIMVSPTSATSLSAAGVPPGVYYVRTRAIGVAGTGPVSNEVAVVVE
jgi:hypothetical protein